MIARIIAVSALLLAVTLQNALPATPGETGNPRRNRPRVGLALPTLAEERWHRDLNAMESQAKELGIDLVTQVTMNDQNQQSFNIEQLITQGVQVLLIAPHDSFGLGRIVDDARRAGIKVISYDRLIMNADIDLYVSYDNLAVGKLQGRFLAENAKTGKYIVLSGPKYDSNAIFYRDGALSELRALRDRGDIEVVLDAQVADWSPSQSQELVEGALTNHPDGIAAVLVPNDGMASGAISALKRHDLAGKAFVTGQDVDANALLHLMDGSQSMSVFKDIAREAEVALRAAMILAENGDVMPLTQGRTIDNGKLEVPAILLEPIFIDKTNLNDVLLQAGHITEPIPTASK